ncbi:MAG: hypothetical protein N7Q72_02520 [Spiroplasma sp. Tabriz.8]|nr:hypothetical protein [Spiroplasma sp. Tabriz.8]
MWILFSPIKSWQLIFNVYHIYIYIYIYIKKNTNRIDFRVSCFCFLINSS